MLNRVPLGQPPFLHRLRRSWRTTAVVRRLLWYYESVRLPAPVHRRRTPLGFTARTAAPTTAVRRGTSRLPCEMFPYLHGVLDLAGFAHASRLRHVRYCLPHVTTASAPRSASASRGRKFRGSIPSRYVPLSTLRPSSLRTIPHDSGPMWFAKLSSYGTFIHYTSPVFAGAPSHSALFLTKYCHPVSPA